MRTYDKFYIIPADPRPVRTTLSLYAEVDPADWRFEAGEYGKPDVCEPKGLGWLRFNLSNTDGLIACAVTRDHELGVDVENMKRRGETVSLATRYFSPTEVASLKALPHHSRPRSTTSPNSTVPRAGTPRLWIISAARARSTEPAPNGAAPRSRPAH